MDLQELISRGRFIFAGAPQRLTIYKLVDGRKTAKLIAKVTKRYVTNVHGDLRRLADIGLIEEKKKEGQTVKKDGFTLYEKTPLARTVPISYFSGPTKLAKPVQPAPGGKHKVKRPQAL